MLPGGSARSQKVLESRGLSSEHKTGYPVSRFILGFNTFYLHTLKLTFGDVLRVLTNAQGHVLTSLVPYRMISSH